MIDALNETVDHRSKDEWIAKDFFQMAHDSVYEAAIGVSAATEASERFGYAVLSPALECPNMVLMLSEYQNICEDLFEVFGITSVNLSEEELPKNPEERKRYVSIVNLYKSAVEILTRFEAIVNGQDPHLWCYWSEVSQHFKGLETPYRLTLKRTPIDISKQIAPLFNENNAVIFTSATLQVSDSFARIRQQLGLYGKEVEKDISERVYASPFPYKENVEIHLFNNVLLDRPRPSDEDEVQRYYHQQARLTEYYVRLRGGRALILCSSNRLLHELYTRLELTFHELGVNVFRQMGTDRLKETVEAFKADETSILFGVASCWEGLDAPGATLETVVIPQLPFAPPHPLTDARKALLDNSDNCSMRLACQTCSYT